MTPIDPMKAFLEVFSRAAASAPGRSADHTAAALATANGEGRLSVRMVLVRQVDERGFLFFTNYESRKAEQMASNPQAALCFYWYWIDEQVRVEGSVARATAAESDAYFATRPRGSQLGAWASQQSQVLSGRPELEDRYHTLEAQFAGADVPRPPFWGGYRLTPERIEFWKSGAFRLHDRLLYVRDDTVWHTQRLYP